MANYRDDYYDKVDELILKIRSNPFIQPLEDPIPHEATGQLNPIGWVENADGVTGEATVIIDSQGITVLNGAIFLQDYSGQSVLSPIGFAGSWVDFIESRVYNGSFGAGTTAFVPAATLVGDAETLANYQTSLSDDVPHWIIAYKAPDSTIQRVIDLNATDQSALEFKRTGSVDWTSQIAIDVPIVPGGEYGIRINVKGSEVPFIHDIEHAHEWRDGNHALISALDVSALISDINFVYDDIVYTSPNNAVAPSNAKFLRVKFWVRLNTATGWIRLNSVSVFRADITTSKITMISLGGAQTTDITYDGYRVNMPGLYLTSTADASLTGVGHALQIGQTSGTNIIVDNNEIMARFNGGTSILYLNNDGGKVNIGSGGLDVATARISTQIEVNIDTLIKENGTGLGFFNTALAAKNIKAKGLLVSNSYSAPDPPSEGIQFGADVSLYRDAPGRLRIPAGKLVIGDDSELLDVNVVNTLGLRGIQDSNMGSLRLGADVTLGRTATNVLTLANDDRLDNRAVGQVVVKTSTQAITNTTWTKVVDYNYHEYSPFGMSWNPYSGSEIRADVAGLWIVNIQAKWQANTTGSRRILGFATANGITPGAVASDLTRIEQGPTAAPVFMNITRIVPLNVNDTIAAVCWQDSGGNLNISDVVLSATRIGTT